jgi:DNA-binding NarL/FixJ family response regulator
MNETVLIVDDHQPFRAAARELLELDGFTVVGEAHDGESGLLAYDELRPAVVLVDVQMPGLDGFAVAARLTRTERPPSVVLTSSRDADDLEDLLRSCGAAAFIPKEALTGAAIRSAIA